MKRMQLEYFVRIVEEKSFTKAAEKLFISQPALSKSIRALEAELGVTLFKRDPRELSLTSEGENVYCYAVDILITARQRPMIPKLIKVNSLRAAKAKPRKKNGQTSRLDIMLITMA